MKNMVNTHCGKEKNQRILCQSNQNRSLWIGNFLVHKENCIEFGWLVIMGKSINKIGIFDTMACIQ